MAWTFLSKHTLSADALWLGHSCPSTPCRQTLCGLDILVQALSAGTLCGLDIPVQALSARTLCGLDIPVQALSARTPTLRVWGRRRGGCDAKNGVAPELVVSGDADGTQVCFVGGDAEATQVCFVGGDADGTRMGFVGGDADATRSVAPDAPNRPALR